MHPLLVLDQERAEETGGCVPLAAPEKLTGKLHGHRSLTSRRRIRHEHAACHRIGQPRPHRPQREGDRVPAKVAEGPERLQVALHANVAGAKLFGSAETKLRGDAADRADAQLVVAKEAADRLEPTAVAKHHAIHKLHAAFLAGGDHLLKIRDARRTRLLHHDVLACLCRLHRPLGAEARGNRQVDRIDVVAGEERVVRPESLGPPSHRTAGLAGVDEGLGLGRITAGHRHQLRVFSIGNREPVLGRDAGSAQDAKATDSW